MLIYVVLGIAYIEVLIYLKFVNNSGWNTCSWPKKQWNIKSDYALKFKPSVIDIRENDSIARKWGTYTHVKPHILDIAKKYSQFATHILDIAQKYSQFATHMVV